LRRVNANCMNMKRTFFTTLASLFLLFSCTMKNIFYLIIVALIATSCNSGDNPDLFVLDRGVNIAHWLSQSDARGNQRQAFFTEKDVEFIASKGFKHIRIPIDEEQMWDENGTRHDDAFLLMTNGIDWAIKNNLCVVIDLHILRSHHFNEGEKPLWTDPAEQQRFIDLWKDLSSALKKYPVSKVAYELMNEPVADNPEDWNTLVEKAFTVVRSLEPKRLIVIGSNRWQSVSTFDVLKVPDDKNIILSFHFYEPFLLTHYHASWTNLREYTGPVHYPGITITGEEYAAIPDSMKPVFNIAGSVDKVFDASTIKEKIAPAIEKAKQLGLRIYCGEYGAVKESPEADRIKWHSDILSVFDELGVGSAIWNYKSSNYGLFYGKSAPDEALIEVIARK